jgi:hypothetical protein
MHHPDYLRPLLIIWMCRECHCELHEWDESIFAASLRHQVTQREFAAPDLRPNPPASVSC